MVGLQYLDASTSQFLRAGSGLIFVALMKQYILKDRLVSFNDSSYLHYCMGTIINICSFVHEYTVHISLGWCFLDCDQCGDY